MNISYGVGNMLDINMIKELWVRKFEDVASEIAVWDSVASEYLLEEKNNFREDPFLQFMEEKIQLSQNMDVLDVGCGAGAYSCRIAERAGNVTGVDFSPRMIEEGQHYVERNHIKNVQFLERNWHTCDGEEFKGKYDMVFAHTTPAVIDYDSFKKMNDASKKYCFISKPTRRNDCVFDEIRKIAGDPSLKKRDDMPLLFDALWLLGYHPELRYDPVVWKSERTVEEAEQWYLRRLKANMRIDTYIEKQVKDYLQSISVNNVVSEAIEVTLTSVFWTV